MEEHQTLIVHPNYIKCHYTQLYKTIDNQSWTYTDIVIYYKKKLRLPPLIKKGQKGETLFFRFMPLDSESKLYFLNEKIYNKWRNLQSDNPENSIETKLDHLKKTLRKIKRLQKKKTLTLKESQLVNNFDKFKLQIESLKETIKTSDY